MIMLKNRQRGFTIIEVMIVLAVAGLIMLIVFLGASALKKSFQKNQAHKDIKTISTSVQIARAYSHKNLYSITGNGCSECICRTNGMQDPTCISNWQRAAGAISVNSVDIGNLTADPWGSPYGLDENEGEFGIADCRPDAIRSAGPDGVLSTSDDIGMTLPLYKNPCP